MNPIKYWLKIFMFHVKLSMAEEGGGGDGGDGGGDEGGEGGDNGGQAAQRPEHVPEKFWDAAAGTVKTEDVLKSYTELESKISTAAEKAIEEYKESLNKDKPKSIDDYKLSLDPEKFGGATVNIKDDDPMLNWFKGFALENGMNNDTFNAAVGQYIESQMAMSADIKGQVSELGENGQARIDRVDMYLQRTLNDENLYNAMASVLDNPRAIMAVEKMIDSNREPDMNAGGFLKGDSISREDIQEMMKDPRYWKTKDPEYIKKVQGYYQKLYPGKNASGS